MTVGSVCNFVFECVYRSRYACWRIVSLAVEACLKCDGWGNADVILLEAAMNSTPHIYYYKSVFSLLSSSHQSLYFYEKKMCFGWEPVHSYLQRIIQSYVYCWCLLRLSACLCYIFGVVMAIYDIKHHIFESHLRCGLSTFDGAHLSFYHGKGR